jgi:SnoaL-like domain
LAQARRRHSNSVFVAHAWVPQFTPLIGATCPLEIPMSDELAVQQVLAHYVRAHDQRDGAAMAALFTPRGRVEIFYNNAGDLEPLGELMGREAIANAVVHMMKPHPPRGWSHNATDGLLIEIDGDRATVDAQFMVFNILGAEKPDAGWPKNAHGAQGTITPVESGYYRQNLVRVNGTWLIASLRVTHNLPLAF